MAAATKAKKRAPRAKKLKQQFIPGTEPESIPAIDAAAETYHEVMTERCGLSKQEDEAKDNLIDKMKEHGVDRYETPHGLVVSITSKSNVKVKRKKDAESAEEEDPFDG